MTAPGRILVIGAGPCGLGAAHALRELGYDDWLCCEAETYPGGLAASFTDGQGFTWDIGGHVLFSRDTWYEQLVRDTLGPDRLEHVRSAWVRTADWWAPYPFQNSLAHLPPAIQEECLDGLDRRPAAAPANFAEWIQSTFGPGIAKHFMLPYNRKVWGTDPERMAFDWIADRVSVPTRAELAARRHDVQADAGWGPNARFVFPKRGGTGEIFRRIAAPLGDRIRYGKELVAVDAARREVRFADGTGERYDVLINTTRLDLLVGMLDRPPAARPAFRPVGGAVVGIGVAAPEDSGRCWSYFPTTPPCFYRLTWFSRYSPWNVPGGDTARYAAYMVETTFRPDGDTHLGNVVERSVDGLVAMGIITKAQTERIVSTYLIPVPAIYPVPLVGLKDATLQLVAELEARNIISRGRFGGWRYELGNMDHAFLQGRQAARRLVCGEPETLWSRD